MTGMTARLPAWLRFVLSLLQRGIYGRRGLEPPAKKK